MIIVNTFYTCICLPHCKKSTSIMEKYSSMCSDRGNDEPPDPGQVNFGCWVQTTLASNNFHPENKDMKVVKGKELRMTVCLWHFSPEQDSINPTVWAWPAECFLVIIQRFQRSDQCIHMRPTCIQIHYSLEHVARPKCNTGLWLCPFVLPQEV